MSDKQLKILSDVRKYKKFHKVLKRYGFSPDEYQSFYDFFRINFIFAILLNKKQ